MKHFFLLTILLLSQNAVTVAADEPAALQPEHRVLWYAKPANVWSKEALPIGNGRLGAMLFGGVTVERIQFNESSLWSGDNNWDGEYDTGDHGFGSYRNFGDLFVEFGKTTDVQVTSPSGHERGDGNVVGNSVDGREDTKWCIDKPGELVVWQAELPEATPVASYALTSANDIPARDPQDWVLAGSNDGKTWNELDRRVLDGPFESRHQTKQFTVEKPAPYRFYRFSFVPKSAAHFQVAEIALGGGQRSPRRTRSARRPITAANWISPPAYIARRSPRTAPRSPARRLPAGRTRSWSSTIRRRKTASRPRRSPAKCVSNRANPTLRSSPTPAGSRGMRSCPTN